MGAPGCSNSFCVIFDIACCFEIAVVRLTSVKLPVCSQRCKVVVALVRRGLFCCDNSNRHVKKSCKMAQPTQSLRAFLRLVAAGLEQSRTPAGALAVLRLLWTVLPPPQHRRSSDHAQSNPSSTDDGSTSSAILDKPYMRQLLLQYEALDINAKGAESWLAAACWDCFDQLIEIVMAGGCNLPLQPLEEILCY
jgi:hypothetical protein